MEHARHQDGSETYRVPGFEITLPPPRPAAGGCVLELDSPEPVSGIEEERARARAIIAVQAATLPADKVIGPTGRRFNPSLEDQREHAWQFLHDGARAALRAAERLRELDPDDETARAAVWLLGGLVAGTCPNPEHRTGRQPTRPAD